MDLLFKNTIPSNFYFNRSLLVVVLIILIFYFHSDYAVILACLLGAFAFSINRYNYVLEIYNDRFIISLPSIYGKRFNSIDTYYFISVSEFEFDKANFNSNELEVKLAKRLYAPGSFINRDKYSKPTLTFKYTENGKISTIKYGFLYDDPEFLKGMVMLDKMIKKEINPKHHH